jgi:hypothetical protein
VLLAHTDELDQAQIITSIPEIFCQLTAPDMLSLCNKCQLLHIFSEALVVTKRIVLKEVFGYNDKSKEFANTAAVEFQMQGQEP